MPDGREHIEALKAAADPDRVTAALSLRGKGRRFFCPICQTGLDHKTPDLSVRAEGFVCFKCGAKGDLLKLIEVAGGLDFPKAVALLESLTGIPAPGRKKAGSYHKGKTPVVNPGRSWTGFSTTEGIKKAEARPGPDPAIYEAFLTACRPVEDRPLEWLTKVKGIAPKVVKDLKIRFCGREYQDVMTELKTRFGEDILKAAGLLKRSSKGARLVPSFWHYYASKTGFLVIPYIKDGRPVYLKARPPLDKAEAERLKLIRFLNTSAAVPCPYNVDALIPQPDKVMICEGESDTWTALSHGFAAVGIPGARNFKAEWTEGFRPFVDADGRSRVILALDADTAGAGGTRIIADLFLKVGLPVPLELKLPSGMDLTDFMKDGMTS